MDPTKLSHGSYSYEIPELVLMDRKGSTRIKINKEMVYSLALEESISEFCVFGTLVLQDPGSARMKGIFKDGLDYIEVTLRGNRNKGGEYYKIRFEIVNLISNEEGKVVGGGWDKITIKLAQYPAYRNLLIWNISKGWNKKLISEIVKDIFDDFLNTEGYYKADKTIEQTKNKLESYCSPFWSPAKNINYLKNYATSANEYPAYHCFFDMENRFHFRSLEDIFSNGSVHEIDLIDIVESELSSGEDSTKKYVRDYFADFAHKEYYKYALAGCSSERFNWFKKKQYTMKMGYKYRLSEQINDLYEKEEDINNMFGSHKITAYRGEKDKGFAWAVADNALITSLGAQSQTQIQVNGITEPERVKAGDTVNIKNKVQGINENIEELNGSWFIRKVFHFWDTRNTIYKQNIDLCRVGKFEH